MKQLNLKIALVMLLVYSLFQVYCINKTSLTYDEPLFAAYGMTILKLQGNKDVKEFDSKLPVTALNAVPRAIEQLFHPGLSKPWSEAQDDIIRGRYISLFISLLLGLLIYKWSRELYGEKASLFSLSFYLLCPNFLAHGVFVSSDIYTCLFLTSAFYFLWKFRQNNRLKDFMFASISVALAEISKFSMIHLFIIIPLLLLATSKQTTEKRKSKPIFLFLLFIGVNWFIISAAHLFYQEFLFLSDYNFTSTTFKNLQNFFGNISKYIPVPLPSSYINSMDIVMYYDKLGGGVPGSLNGEPYILGDHSRYGFWYYYFVSIFFKVPIATLVIWIVSTALLCWRKNRTGFFKNEIFLLLPVIYFLVQLNFFYTVQVGIRHIMIIFPLLFILSGKLIGYFIEQRKSYLLYILLLWQLISVASYFPHFLPYTNEFIINKRNAYKRIADSNLCYGEGKKYLEKYLQDNKDAIYMPTKPTAGKIVMEINEMLNLNISTVGKYDWTSNLDPVDHIHSEYLIFDVSQATADSLSKHP